MTKWIECKYKCTCHKDERVFLIPERGVAEDISEFMHRAKVGLTKDHREKSSFCMATKVEYLKIPFNDDKVGGAGGGTA